MVNCIKQMWTGLCRISQMTATENTDTGRMDTNENVIASDIPCYLWVKSYHASDSKISELKSSATLFIDKEQIIPTGAKVTVTQNGVTTDYAFAGVPRIYESHKEVPLTLLERWA